MMNYGKVDATADEIKNVGEPLLAANGVEVIVMQGNESNPILTISHVFLMHKSGRNTELSDGIINTPLQNPLYNGRFKYISQPEGPEMNGLVDG